MRCPKCGRDGPMVYSSGDDPPTCVLCYERNRGDDLYHVLRWFLVLLAAIVAVLLAMLLAEGG